MCGLLQQRFRVARHEVPRRREPFDPTADPECGPEAGAEADLTLAGERRGEAAIGLGEEVVLGARRCGPKGRRERRDGEQVQSWSDCASCR